MPEGSVTAVDLAPLGSLSLFRVQDLAARLSRRVAIPCRAVALGNEDPPRALPGRDQADADALLASLETQAAPGAVLVGVTDQDIAVPVFTFVFGLAREGGRAALVSLARLDPSFYGLAEDHDSLARRAVDEMLHELGHLAALRHCDEAACLMRFAGSVEKADVRGSFFCAACEAHLPLWLRGSLRRPRGATGSALRLSGQGLVTGGLPGTSRRSGGGSSSIR